MADMKYFVFKGQMGCVYIDSKLFIYFCGECLMASGGTAFICLLFIPVITVYILKI